jgi:enediyne biosynthesis protein E4
MSHRLTLTACAMACALSASAWVRTEPRPLFIDAAEQCGVRFVHGSGAAGQFYMPEPMGPGVAVFDYDNDGDLDILFVQGAPVAGGHSPRGGNRLFRNDGVANGVPRFTDVTTQAGVGLAAVGMGVAVGDIDNDGWLDLYVTNFGPNALYRNRGDGTFEDVTARMSADDPRFSASAAFLDYDRDGFLDLFVTNYVTFTVAGNKVCTDHAGARDHCPPGAYQPVPPRLFHNEGGRRFKDVSDASGVTRAYGAGLGVAVGDLDGDGWPDVYVANDATPNQLWINQHDGTFEDRGLLSGTALSALGRPEGSMGIALGDVDNDGDEDLFVTNIVGESHVLYLNDGHANFDDARTRSGVGAPTASMTGFGTDWLDYDNDGRLDLFIANGAINIVEGQRGQPNPYRQQNQLLHNEGGGRLVDVSASAGPAFSKLDVARGAAFGDLDNDGDIDVVVTNNNGAARVLLNQQNQPSQRNAPAAHWLEVALRAASGNRFGVGARIGFVRSGVATTWRRARSDGSYLSANDLRVHVGLGASEAVDDVVVEWPDAARESFGGQRADRILMLMKGTGRAASPADSR